MSQFRDAMDRILELIADRAEPQELCDALGKLERAHRDEVGEAEAEAKAEAAIDAEIVKDEADAERLDFAAQCVHEALRQCGVGPDWPWHALGTAEQREHLAFVERCE